MNTLIEFVDVNKQFSDRLIYQSDLSFSINKNDKFCLSGQSGSGKSTALNLMMGFILADKGQVLIKSESISPQVVHNFRKQCGWIPQSFNFLKGLTVRKAILTPFEYTANSGKIPSENTLEEYLSKVKLDKRLLENEISSLSGGERQRICAVIALLLNREIIILDEPTSNLDSVLSTDVINLFLNSDKTIIISTHDKNIAERCNKLVELK